MAVVGKKSKGEKAFDILNYSFMVIFVIAILYPVLNVISISLSDDYYVLTSQVSFFPRGLDLDAYKEVFGNSTLLRAYGNTIVIAAVGCILSLVFTSFAAYPLAFSNFKGKKAVSLFIVFTMWFNGGMIPNFIVMRELHLLNSLWSLV
ncbi:MAG: carbohydrate ABC transporter permease, partial [Angelakisella sp.]